MKGYNPKDSNDELSIKEVLSFFKQFIPFWRTALVFLLVPLIISAVLGYFTALIAPVEYDATAVMITDQVANSGSGSLSNLASLAGVQVSSTSAEGSLGADIYPLLLSNKPFLLEFSQTPIFFEEINDSITLHQFFETTYDQGFVHNVKTFFKGENFSYGKLLRSINHDKKEAKLNQKKDSLDQRNTDLFLSNRTYIAELTSEDKKIISILRDRIKFTQTGKFINASVKMPDAQLSAETTRTLISLMIKYITSFKLSKQLEDYHFLEKRTLEAEERYKKAQYSLANFKDSNYNVVFESYKVRGMQLENEFSLSFSLYNQFVTQLEQAKIQLKKETPLFTMVEPVYIPDAQSADPMKSAISFVSFGIVFGILLNIFLFFKILLKR